MVEQWVRRRRALGLRGVGATVAAAACAGALVLFPAAASAAKGGGGSGGSGGSGSTTGASTLIVYDTTGTWGWLGELDAIQVANLAGHFGSYKAEPVVDYTAGQLNSYTAVVYVASTYGEPVPQSFVTDVTSTTKPVIWAGVNLWSLSQDDASFASTYGWDPGSSFYEQGTVDEVDYKGQALTRNASNNASNSCGSCIIDPDITNPSAVTVLATAVDSSTSPATDFPWAIRSRNLTYLGEDPFAYTSGTDRQLAFDDLLFDALAPSTATSHRAMVRLEDVSPLTSASTLQQVTDWLRSNNIPFSVNVIPYYTDPEGYYTNGVPRSIHLSQNPKLVSLLKSLIKNGETVNMEGYTHQWTNPQNPSQSANPYDGASGDDFEFYRAQCSPTVPASSYDDPCPNTDYVIEEGPVPGDSGTWAVGRIQSGYQEFSQVGLPQPKILVVPHYAASVADYQAFAPMFSARYDRAVYFGGLLSGSPIDYTHEVGQYFPYVVKDVYGSKVIPENLGEYQPTWVNNNPPVMPSDLIHEAQLNLAVRDGFASFFYDPNFGTGPLSQIVSGIQGLGYTFVSPSGL